MLYSEGGLTVVVVGAAGEADGVSSFLEITSFFFLLWIHRAGFASFCFRWPLKVRVFMGPEVCLRSCFMIASRSDNISVVTGMVSPGTCTDTMTGWVGMLVEDKTGTGWEVLTCSSTDLGGMTLRTSTHATSYRWSGDVAYSELS